MTHKSINLSIQSFRTNPKNFMNSVRFESVKNQSDTPDYIGALVYLNRILIVIHSNESKVGMIRFENSV